MTDESEHIDIQTYRQVTTDMLGRYNTISIISAGLSMFPMLKPHNTLIIEKVSPESISCGDVIVFSRPDKTIGHRVIAIQKNGSDYSFITRGDNCKHADLPVHQKDVIGRVTGYIRADKQYSLNSWKAQFIRFLILYFGFPTRVCIRIFARIYTVIRSIKKTVCTVRSQLQFIIADSRKHIIKSGILSVLQGILPFVIIFCVKLLIDALTHVQETDNTSELYMLIAITACVFILQVIVLSMANLFREQLSHSISQHIHTRIHAKHASLDFTHLENPDKQDTIHRARVEAGYRPQKLVQAVLLLLRSFIAAGIILYIVLSIHWAIACILCIGLFPGFFVRARIAKKMYHLHQKQSSRERKIFYFNHILTAIPFAKELRLFNTAHFFSHEYAKEHNSLHVEKMQILTKQFRGEIFTQMFAIVLVFISFAFVVYMAIHGSISIGTVVLFFLVFQRGFTVIKELFQSVANVFQDSIHFADVMAFMSIPTSSSQNSSPESTSLPLLKKGITFSNVSFQYPSSTRTALQKINLNIPAGKTVAIVGANGSGKTTLLKLLCGFYAPTNGTILYDDIPLEVGNQQKLRNTISAVFQDFALYNMTAAENIWLGNVAFPLNKEKVKQAGHAAGLSGDIQALPEGYTNMIGNYFAKGEELSIGQWQKLAIARAYYRNKDIILLDEPSSALDPKSEHEILSSLQALGKEKTVVIISHRLSSIKWADIICVMKDGTIVEKGTHQELLNKRGLYWHMHNVQNK
ncbi:MAG: signal peptidase I [Bacteroidota bacterium]